jgi:hypothetical protein
MHAPSPKIKEDIKFPKMLTAKQLLEKDWKLNN